ncbi:MAG: GNAT family N-acetyltransferase [Ilumatobacteraceae bacterium]
MRQALAVVTLREIRDGDEEWIFEACQDPEIQRWTRVPRPYLRSHAEEFVAARGLTELAVWVVCDDERPIGVIGVHSVDPSTGDAEIGYWIAPWGRGRRATSSAIEAVATWASERSDVRALTAKMSEANLASKRSARRAGWVEAERIVDGCHDGDRATTAILFRRPLV